MAKHYESDVTQFINQYKKQHPDTELRQREGRARLWDKNLDPELQEGFKQARVPQKPYVYQTN
ncbi:DUF3460 family protein [Achromobacter sp. F4_2707]|uniref:DUF3460 family protein n=1 Tax=Achromobacter sp. F4_2707 TaxID=3114286 RepID=UPI0039C746E7